MKVGGRRASCVVERAENCLRGLVQCRGTSTYLHHQADNKNHRHATDNVSMILNDELMAQDRRVLLVLLAAERFTPE